jgi:hypothetical protein
MLISLKILFLFFALLLFGTQFFTLQLYENKRPSIIHLRELPNIKSKIIAKIPKNSLIVQWTPHYEVNLSPISYSSTSQWSFSWVQWHYGYIYHPLLSKKKISFLTYFHAQNEIFSFVLLFILSMIVYFLRLFSPHKKKHSIKPSKIKKRRPPSQSFQPISTITSPSSEPLLSKRKTTAEKKGDAFEEYIAYKIHENSSLTLQCWRSDKYIPGAHIFAEENRYPDFEIGYTFENKKKSFAIECKWRSNFYNDSIIIGAPYKIKDYTHYQKRTQQPVFIVIGVSGTPKQPEYLFIVPLDAFSNVSISSKKLFKYFQKQKKSPLCFDHKKKMLY